MNRSRSLRLLVGVAAVVAPVLHSITDVMEWVQDGFSATQLWLNYLAFLPMPWLLLGMYALHAEELPSSALAGAVLYGVAFTYFAHTTLYALQSQAPDYEVLWQQLGVTYTIHGAAMVVGGLLFAASALRSRAMPRPPVLLFAIGLLVNLGLALAPAPDILQTIGTAVRNAGIVGMGYALVSRRKDPEA